MYVQVKRLIDVLVSAGLIVLLAPVWICAALAVKLGSPGPILFRQTRGGWHGRPFESYKFRTMRADHVHDPREIVPLSHPAVTGIGRVLRRLKVDELPQLFNVLKGDMSLVGPRPTLMDQVAAYDDYKRQRLLVRPGLTGLAQVNGNAQISWDERIHYDVYYVRHFTPGMDLYILLKTVLVVVLGEDRFSRPFAESPFAARARRPGAAPAKQD